VQVRPFPANGSTRLENREGGLNPLWVFESRAGVYTSTWAICNKQALAMLKKSRGKAAMTIVIDTNSPGHPTVSVVLQPIEVVPDHPDSKE
jgi:hypothetical protein